MKLSSLIETGERIAERNVNDSDESSMDLIKLIPPAYPLINTKHSPDKSIERKVIQPVKVNRSKLDINKKINLLVQSRTPKEQEIQRTDIQPIASSSKCHFKELKSLYFTHTTVEIS